MASIVQQVAPSQWVGGGGVAQSQLPYSEWWAPPSVAGALDVEFNTTTLPSAFTLFNVNASPATIVTPISGVDFYTQPAAGNVRIQANMDGKRSWLCCQPRAENIRWFYAQKITLTGTLGWTFRSRILTHIRLNGGNNNASIMRFCLCKDDGTGTKPSFIVDGWCLGWESDPNTMQIETNVLKTSVSTPLWLSSDKDDPNSPVDFEFVAVLKSGALNQTWDFWIRSSNLTWLIGQADSGAIGIRQSDTIWVGWDFLGLDDIPVGSGRAPILCADYMRITATQANFLP